MYLVTPAGMQQKSDFVASFLKRKLQEYEVLRPEIELLQSEAEK